MLRIASIILAASFLLITACTKRNKDTCSFLPPKIVFVNFTIPETDTIIIRRFANNNQFNQFLDTSVFSKTQITRTVLGQDSVQLSIPYDAFNESFAAFNWEVFLPGTSSLTRFSDFQSQFNHEEQEGSTCHSYVQTVKVNNRTNTYNTWFGEQYRIYITK